MNKSAKINFISFIQTNQSSKPTIGISPFELLIFKSKPWASPKGICDIPPS